MPRLHHSHEPNYYSFQCPGCEESHMISLGAGSTNAWGWNGSIERPTITPSILINVGGSNPTAPICHSFVTDGRIRFLADCTHKLAGQEVEIPEWSEDRTDA
jgi:hypothetical protein